MPIHTTPTSANLLHFMERWAASHTRLARAGSTLSGVFAAGR